jgi:hypothetical protein
VLFLGEPLSSVFFTRAISTYSFCIPDLCQGGKMCGSRPLSRKLFVFPIYLISEVMNVVREQKTIVIMQPGIGIPEFCAD